MQITIYVEESALLFMDRFLNDSLVFERSRNAGLIHGKWNSTEALPHWVQVQVSYEDYFRLLNIEDGLESESI